MIEHITQAIQSAFTLDKIALHVVVTIISWVTVIGAVLIDLWDGVYTAKILKQSLRSNRFRHTIQKTGEYWRVLLFAFILDSLCMLMPWYGFSYATIVAAVALIAIEIKSMYEHIRKRKSGLAELPEIISDIIKCRTAEDAAELVSKIKSSK